MFSRIKRDLFLLLAFSAIPAFYNLRAFITCDDPRKFFFQNIQITHHAVSLGDFLLSFLALFAFYFSLIFLIRILLTFLVHTQSSRKLLLLNFWQKVLLSFSIQFFMIAWLGVTLIVSLAGVIVSIVSIEEFDLHNKILDEEKKIQEKEQTDFLEQFEPN